MPWECFDLAAPSKAGDRKVLIAEHPARGLGIKHNVYVLYAHDAPIGGQSPRWGDQCPSPPAPTGDGCVISGRLSRLRAAGNVMTGAEEVLITVRVRVSDAQGASDVASMVVTIDTPPVAVIDTPGAAHTFAVEDHVTFSGGATDEADGTLAASALSWSLILHHCSSDGVSCHAHAVQTFDGVASCGFNAPDHQYPSHLKLRLTATDSGGLRASTSVELQPRTALLTFEPQPSGIPLSVGGEASVTPFQRTVMVGSNNSIAADAAAPNGTSWYPVTAIDSGGNESQPAGVSASVATLPDAWQAQDIGIGSSSVAGSATYAGGTYTVTGAGADIWNTKDEFQFVSQPLGGKATLVARIDTLGNTNTWAKAGLRERLEVSRAAIN